MKMKKTYICWIGLHASASIIKQLESFYMPTVEHIPNQNDKYKKILAQASSVSCIKCEYIFEKETT